MPFVKTLDLALIKLNQVYVNKDKILDLTQNKNGSIKWYIVW